MLLKDQKLWPEISKRVFERDVNALKDSSALLMIMDGRVPVIITAGEQDSRHIFYDPLLSGNISDMVSPITHNTLSFTVAMPAAAGRAQPICPDSKSYA